MVSLSQHVTYPEVAAMKPKYTEIYEALVEKISHMNPGEQLKSERQLAESFAVAPMTVRRALMQLNQEGLTTPQPGKGTFVAARKTSSESRPEVVWPALTPDFLFANAQEATAQQRRDFKVDAGTLIVTITRALNGSGKREGEESLEFLASEFPDLLSQDLSNPTPRWLADVAENRQLRISGSVGAHFDNGLPQLVFEAQLAGASPLVRARAWTKGTYIYEY